jgi:uncharacterized protein (DUF849 family)
VGLLLSLAPSAAAAASLPVLLRIAVDAEQMGAARLHLPPDLPDAARAVAELRARTRMVLTTDPDGAAATLCDRPGSLFREVVLDPADPAILVAAVAGLAADARIGPGQILSVSGRGRAGMAVMLAAVAAGLQVRVGSADSAHSADPADGPAPARELGPDPARDDIGLIARAAGIARIAGRQLLGGAAARELLGVG